MMDEQSCSTRNGRWQLRVLNGPLCGATYAVGARLSIGRDATSDIQLSAQEVSRNHARIERGEDGTHVLVDLDSSNGTYVDGVLVRRHLLEPHAEITIADVELAYEPVPELLRPPMVPSPGGEPNGPRRAAHTPVMAARRHAPTTPVGIAVPAGAIRDRSGHALVFEHPEIGPYVGNLLADIVEYRTLRARQLRGGLADPKLVSTFDRLKLKLKQPPSPGGQVPQRGFRRFGCWLFARLQLPSDEELSCHVCEVGVDGAQLVVEAHQVPINSPVRLAVDLVEAGNKRSIVLPGRASWTDGERLAMDFSGAPRREEGRYARRSTTPQPTLTAEEPTKLMLRPPSRPRAS
ncbi:FHA domain-containing protein [Paraliomyxa miuraensis]|uniref:FHA domain-containing protein n=1 Tax=Paraliomyxa miuraensis TaxID=376150 RepID=UPI0022500AF0|nr:FHA domain-containing protein [Paraliomyxa miuraensis]MCX4241987.1 FHA domain-containing protein [Paraliomyxa miuraensis]